MIRRAFAHIFKRMAKFEGVAHRFKMLANQLLNVFHRGFPTTNDIGNLSNAAPYEYSVDCFALI
jgi:hypothetical protein